MLLLGTAFIESIILVKLFSIVIITFSAGEIFSYLVLLPYQYEKIFNKIVWISTVLHLIFLLISVNNLSEIGAVYSIIATEVILTAACTSAVLKRGLVKNNI